MSLLVLFSGTLIYHKIKSEGDEDPSVPGQCIDLTAHASSERHGIGGLSSCGYPLPITEEATAFAGISDKGKAFRYCFWVVLTK